MTAVTGADSRLHDTEGFVVESPEGDLGWVEEVWVGDSNEPLALAVRTTEGRHGLLMGSDVLAVDRENHWVVVPARPELLELGSPRLVFTLPGDRTIRLAASWRTTGEVLQVAPRAHRAWHLPFRLPRLVPADARGEPRLLDAVAVLLTSIALIAALYITLAFVVARLVTGDAY